MHEVRIRRTRGLTVVMNRITVRRIRPACRAFWRVNFAANRKREVEMEEQGTGRDSEVSLSKYDREALDKEKQRAILRAEIRHDLETNPRYKELFDQYLRKLYTERSVRGRLHNAVGLLEILG